MARYLIVDSRDLTEYTSGQFLQKIARKLKENGNEVTLFLIENGVIAARKGADIGKGLTELTRRGTRVLAEDVSCRSRGISQLADGLTQSNMDQLADLIAEGSDKILWY